jgi:hypothetical protein
MDIWYAETVLDGYLVPMYHVTSSKKEQTDEATVSNQQKKVERVQTGVRMEKRVLMVLKALAAHHEIGLGDLLEGIVLHSFEGKPPFGEESLAFIEQMRIAYKLDLKAADSHKLSEE